MELDLKKLDGNLSNIGKGSLILKIEPAKEAKPISDNLKPITSYEK